MQQMTEVMKRGLPIDICNQVWGVLSQKGVPGELLVRIREAEWSLDQELSRAYSRRGRSGTTGTIMKGASMSETP